MSAAAGRVLAIDLGSVRIGLALSDPRRVVAQPLETLQRVGPRKDLQRIAELVARHEASVVVVGLPRLLSGGEGKQAAAARAFADKLQSRLPGRRVDLWDERLTTAEAERTMISGNVRRRRRKEVVDTLAAVLILQGYLDAHGTGE